MFCDETNTPGHQKTIYQINLFFSNYVAYNFGIQKKEIKKNEHV